MFVLKSTTSSLLRASSRIHVLPRFVVAAPTILSRAMEEVCLQSSYYSSSALRSDDRKTSGGVVPSEDYYEGHLMADHLEFLEDMMEKTTVLEESLQNLHDTHEQLVQSKSIKWMDGADIDQLLEPTRKQKESLQEQLKELKQLMKSARQTFAVDAPDGESDAYEKQELRHIQQIIETAAEVEDTDAILRQRALDAENKKTFAVDAPDGDSDGHVKEEMAHIRHIIDDAAVLEDTNKINYQHKMNTGIQKDRARDPEHDW